MNIQSVPQYSMKRHIINHETFTSDPGSPGNSYNHSIVTNCNLSQKGNESNCCCSITDDWKWLRKGVYRKWQHDLLNSSSKDLMYVINVMHHLKRPRCQCADVCIGPNYICLKTRSTCQTVPPWWHARCYLMKLIISPAEFCRIEFKPNKWRPNVFKGLSWCFSYCSGSFNCSLCSYCK